MTGRGTVPGRKGLDMAKVMRYGYRYTNKGAGEDEGQYRYAEPVEYADGAWLGDCWLVNAAGEIHPGYNASPVPLHAANLTNPVPVKRG